MTAQASDQPSRFFFVHIMKTAGSALRLRLINHFGKAAVYPTGGLDGTDPLELYLSTDRLLEQLRARGDQIRVITGHFPLRTAELIDGPVSTLTLLREPVERTLSYLRQQREDPSVLRFLAQRTHEASQAAGRPLTEIYDDLRGLGGTDNTMTRMFSLTPREMIDSMLTPMELNRGHLERAREALARVDAVGLQERFEEFCERLTARFGWRLGEAEIANATDPFEVPEGLRAQIAEDNAFDVELYEFAERLVASAGDRRSVDTAGAPR
jgi:hypothetical protein